MSRWQTIPARDHHNDRPPRWQTTLTTDHPDERPPRWETTDERPSWWHTTPMTDRPDERPHWWKPQWRRKKTLLEPQFFSKPFPYLHAPMKNYPDEKKKKNFSVRTTFYPKIFPIISPCKYLTKDRPSFKATVIGFLGWSQTDGFHCTSKYPQTSMCRVKSQRWKMSSILSHALSPNITPHTLTKFQRRCTVNCKLTKDTIICNKLHWKKIIFFSLSFFQRKIGERDYV